MNRDNIWEAGSDVWPRLQGKKIFLTGGTGFFGRSFLELIGEFTEKKGFHLQITVLTRDVSKFKSDWNGKLKLSSVKFIEGEITSFKFPEENFDYVLHFATPASATLNLQNPLKMFNIILEGSRHVLEFSRHAKVKSVLFSSSGAVYGKQPSDMAHVPESYSGAPFTHLTASSYGEAKRAAELLGNIYSKMYGFDHKIARCYAFIGPHLDPDGTFAIGNFIRDAIAGKAIEIKGDGRPYRSYMYSDDLVLWLLKILLDGENGRAYNVGSDEDLAIEELAYKVFAALGLEVKVNVLGKPREGSPAERYVPSIELAKDQLNLKILTPLDEAIRETARRYQSSRK